MSSGTVHYMELLVELKMDIYFEKVDSLDILPLTS